MRRRLPSLLAVCLLASTAAAQDPVPFADWETQVDGLMDEVRSTRQLRDRLAFLREAGQLVRRKAEPREEYVAKLSRLLKDAPEGELLDGVLDALVADGGAPAIKALMEALTRDDYVNLKGRALGEDATAMRRRIVEFRLLEAADAAYTRALEGETPDVAGEVQAQLVADLAHESPRRARGAALLLGGWAVKDAGPKLLERLQGAKDSWTRAVLLEALGRTQPALADEQALSSARARETSERLAATPLLGFFESEEAEKQLAKAIKDKRWFVRRAAIEACDIRRSAFCLDLLVQRLSKEGPRLQKTIYTILQHATDGQAPHDPKEIQRWWSGVKEGFQAVPKGEKREVKVEGAMATRVRQPKTYFTITVASDQVAIVFDTSGSMLEGRIRLPKDEDGKGGGIGTPFDMTKKQIAGLIRGFRGKARFNLVSYSDKVNAFKKKLVPNSRGNLKAADKWLGGLKAKGETNLYDALMLALSDPEVDTIFLLSDGTPNRGERTETRDILEGIQLANRFRKVVINTITIGRPQQLMRKIAETNGGQHKLVEHEGAGKGAASK